MFWHVSLNDRCMHKECRGWGKTLAQLKILSYLLSHGRTWKSDQVLQVECSMECSLLREQQQSHSAGTDIVHIMLDGVYYKSLYTECKYSGSLCRPGSSCAKARLVRPQEFCFDCSSLRMTRSIWFASSCCLPERHENRDFTQAGTTFTFPRSFHKEVKDSCDSARRWEAI